MMLFNRWTQSLFLRREGVRKGGLFPTQKMQKEVHEKAEDAKPPEKKRQLGGETKIDGLGHHIHREAGDETDKVETKKGVKNVKDAH
ncbi:hypothetical protein GO013_14280 [Pseudodesulfovibrio sp. JC047]|uniref:hypothetical protein n=1 Tax=Pseudodesulfovibrio sp. JC047 TaxID=2683199 RepID=UPI0013D5EE35|nr:hypothetical protein [Pseudodesulfovibrio sp. JC047]NDV20575.1 hypothetical protein [Pseudodesulfovibrio sp. JC047]